MSLIFLPNLALREARSLRAPCRGAIKCTAGLQRAAGLRHSAGFQRSAGLQRPAALQHWNFFFPALFALLLAVLSSPAPLRAAPGCAPLPRTPADQAGQLAFDERAPTPPNAAAPILIGLHGLGHHRRGFSRLGARLPRAWRLIWVDAPLVYRRGFAWYRPRCAEAAEDIEASTSLLLTLARELQRRYPRAPKPALFGFSQGAVMTLSALDAAPERWAAGVSLAGYWHPQRPPRARYRAREVPPALLFVHGSADERIPLRLGERAAGLFSDAGFPVAWWGDESGHRVSAAGLQALTEHLRLSWDARAPARGAPAGGSSAR